MQLQNSRQLPVKGLYQIKIAKKKYYKKVLHRNLWKEKKTLHEDLWDKTTKKRVNIYVAFCWLPCLMWGRCNASVVVHPVARVNVFCNRSCINVLWAKNKKNSNLKSTQNHEVKMAMLWQIRLCRHTSDWREEKKNIWQHISSWNNLCNSPVQ